MRIIGIAGGTGSGKTKLAHQIPDLFPEINTLIISQDAYYKPHPNLSFEARCQLNFDHPDALDFDLMFAQIETLKKGKKVAQPIYDFGSHERCQETQIIHPPKLLIIEGILIFTSPQIRNLMDYKIYVEANPQQRLARRLKRDIEERNRTQEEVLLRYESTLKPMHDTYIEPTKKFADWIMKNNTNTPMPVEEVKARIQSLLNKTKIDEAIV